jgi:hypothetical protein
MVRYFTEYNGESTTFWISHMVNSKVGIDFATLFTLWASLSATTQQVGKSGELQILCCQGIAVADYSLTSAELSRCPPLTPPAKRDFTSDLLYEGVQ